MASRPPAARRVGLPALLLALAAPLVLVGLTLVISVVRFGPTAPGGPTSSAVVVLPPEREHVPRR